MASAMPEYLTIGQVVGPFGVRGELKVHILTDFPERFRELKNVVVGPERVPHRVEKARLHKRQVILKLSGIETPEQAEALRGREIAVPIEEAWPLAEDEFYLYQLPGLQVVSTQGDRIGEVVDVLALGSTGANDVLVVRSGEKDVLIPLVKAIVKRVDLKAGTIQIEPIEGLL